jgi:hypothetical protein
MLPIGNSLRQDGLYWQRQGDYLVGAAEELAQEVKQTTIFCGDLSASARRKLAETLGPLALFASPLACVRRAGLLADLASQRLERGEVDNPLTLEPLYLRRPHITMSTRQRPQLLGRGEDAGAEPPGQGTGSAHLAGNAGDERGHLNRPESRAKSQGGLLDAKAGGMVSNGRWDEPAKNWERQAHSAPGDRSGGHSDGRSWGLPT